MLILASRSPRRSTLLQTLGVLFDVVPSDLYERPPVPGEDPAAYVRELASLKAAHVGTERRDDVVLAADTDVWLGGRIFGKPADPDDAMRMLLLLRGREHHVTTAVVARSGGREHIGHVTSTVRMRAFSDQEARLYVESGEPMDKAGGYAVQEFGGSFVEAVEGCYNAVVGLPLCLTAQLLADCGVRARLPADSSCRH